MILRDNYLQELIQFKDTDFIKVITGVRRSGKSVLLMQYRDYLQNQGAAPEKWMLEAGDYTMKRFAGLYGMTYGGMVTNKNEATKLGKNI